MNLPNLVWTAFRNELRAQATASHLRSRSDRTLADLGLPREDILRVARAAARHEGQISLTEIMATLGPSSSRTERLAHGFATARDATLRMMRGLPPVATRSHGVAVAR